MKNLIILVLVFSVGYSVSYSHKNEDTISTKLIQYVKKGFKETIRFYPVDSGKIIGLPFPYNTSYNDKKFQEMYYWDTYFINIGLMLTDNPQQALNNCNNLLFLVEKFGFVPEANLVTSTNRSQIPSLSNMVLELFNYYRDTSWLRNAYSILLKEYNFWMTQRISPVGLNVYGTSANTTEIEAFGNAIVKEKFPDAHSSNKHDFLKFSKHLLAETESWAFTPRYEGRCMDFIPLDLNCALYQYEKNFARFSDILENGEKETWLIKAEKRKELINKYLWNKEIQCFVDYDFVNQKQSNLITAAIFYALWCKVATHEQAKIIKEQHLPKLEKEYGIVACEPTQRKYTYQWDYPNALPPLQFVAIQGLKNYLFDEDAERIAEKYVKILKHHFTEKGGLVEVYDATTGKPENKNRMSEKFGWTAGVFVFCENFIKKQNAYKAIYNVPRGMFFTKKTYTPQKLYTFEEAKPFLPRPIFNEQPGYIEMYYKTWEIAFKHIYEPAPNSGFVSPYSDAAFNENMFLWDASFIAMFTSYGMPYVPGILSLDNFYAKQFPDGEICREINRATGREYPDWVNWERKPLFSRWRSIEIKGETRFNYSANDPVVYIGREQPKEIPYLTLDALNHPILAWAELESVRITGNIERLKDVYLPLKKYYEALQYFLKQGNGLYVSDWAAMDNSPRNEDVLFGGTCVDISSEMVLFANNLYEIAKLIGKYEDTSAYKKDAEILSKIINEKMWNEKEKFYYDLKANEEQSKIKTIAGFWTLISGVATPERAAWLEKELNNPKTFNRKHRVPTLAADQPYYNPLGGYWKGSAWAPTNTMIIRGLEKYGFNKTAREIAINHLENVFEVFKKTGTLWENYAPDTIAPGNESKNDFVGWSGMAPILYLFEYAIGLKPDALNNKLVWNIYSEDISGCEQYRFNNHTVSLKAFPSGKNKKNVKIEVISDGEFQLVVTYKNKTKTIQIKKGEQIIKM